MKNNHQESNSFDNMYLEKPELFGHPYKELQDYFNNYPKKGTLLDLGSGQGRDSMYLASIRYQVTSVDSSKIGIKQMIKKANSQGVKINGIVSDIFDLKLDQKFDIILFDMILHVFEKQKQIELLKKYSSQLIKNGILCIVFPDDFKASYFLDIFKSIPYEWKILDEIKIKDVPKIKGEDENFTFKMITIQKDN